MGISDAVIRKIDGGPARDSIPLVDPRQGQVQGRKSPLSEISMAASEMPIGYRVARTVK